MRLPPPRIAVELRWQLERLGVDVANGPPLEAIVEAQRERAKTLKEMAQASLFFFRDPETYDEKAAAQEFHRRIDGAPADHARGAGARLLTGPRRRSMHVIEGLAGKAGVGLGKLAQPLRVAVSGGGVSPPIDQTLTILGREAHRPAPGPGPSAAYPLES